MLTLIQLKSVLLVLLLKGNWSIERQTEEKKIFFFF